MVALEKLTPERFPDVYATFLRDDDPHLSESDWRRLFQPGGGVDHCGYILVDSGAVVGMLGMIFSERTIHGRQESFCNLHSWNVAPSHRGHSLRLMQPVLKMHDVTVTDFTPTPSVCRISGRLGFKPLASKLRILPPLPGFRRRNRTDRQWQWDDEIDLSLLSDADQRIHHDQGRIGLSRLAVSDGSGVCSIVFSRIERHWLPYCYIHYVNDCERFAALHSDIRHALMHRCQARFVAIDDRTVRGQHIAWSMKLPMQARQLYRSRRVQPEYIDNLYSEVSMLRLTTFPDLGSRMRSLVPRIFPKRQGMRDRPLDEMLRPSVS